MNVASYVNVENHLQQLWWMVILPKAVIECILLLVFRLSSALHGGEVSAAP